MERKRDFVPVHGVCVREINDVEAEVFVGGHHGERFVVYVGGYIPFRHANDDVVASFFVCIFDSGQIEMAA